MSDRTEHDQRGSIHHERDVEGADRYVFDRFIFVPGVYHKADKPCRLRLHYDSDDGLIDLIDENTTSEAKSAEGITDGWKKYIVMTDEQAKWLYEQLGVLLAKLAASSGP